jgi:hypothetical protein
MSAEGEKIIVKPWRKTAHRSPLATTTINLSIPVHARVKKIREATGLTHNAIIAMAMDELEKKIEVSP